MRGSVPCRILKWPSGGIDFQYPAWKRTYVARLTLTCIYQWAISLYPSTRWPKKTIYESSCFAILYKFLHAWFSFSHAEVGCQAQTRYTRIFDSKPFLSACHSVTVPLHRFELKFLLFALLNASKAGHWPHKSMMMRTWNWRQFFKTQLNLLMVTLCSKGLHREMFSLVEQVIDQRNARTGTWNLGRYSRSSYEWLVSNR